ncbi:actin family protein [Vibrio alginolyticus]|uniref:actin family protein n=1 Tax=Vibrio alginolyticus TaxID=663 RepID=UPI00215D0F6B|nr:actin family protein [Vibrio alginolyticus]MCS0003176.1 actin family protein [Vibrio alginolyticus]
MSNFSPVVVIDLGSHTIKAGFAGEESPQVVFDSAINKGVMFGALAKDARTGYEVNKPIERGIITDWESLEMILNHIYKNELNIDPQEHLFLFTESPLNPNDNHEKLIKMQSEKFSTPRTHIDKSPSLSLFATGRTTGIVIDIGHSSAHIVPIFKGKPLLHAVSSLDLAGDDITTYLMDLLSERGYSFTTEEERVTVSDIKEKLCYIAEDFEDEMSKARIFSTQIQKDYELPYGNVITVGDERFRAPEILFYPSNYGLQKKGIHELCYDSIMKCDVDIHKDLYSNIVLSGGSTLFDGFCDRLYKELKLLAPPSMKCKVVAMPERKYSAWIGGSILASLSSFAKGSILP